MQRGKPVVGFDIVQTSHTAVEDRLDTVRVTGEGKPDDCVFPSPGDLSLELEAKRRGAARGPLEDQVQVVV